MSELKALLKNKGIINVALIDDGFDETPQPNELIEADWDSFFDDLQGEQINELIEQKFPGYSDASVDDLRKSTEFIATLWEMRTSLPEGPYNHLFQGYETSSNGDRLVLDGLVQSLEELELTCVTMGRELDHAAKQADLVFIDLFLGYPQLDKDIEQSILRVKEIISDRANKPPLVVLMSSSSRIREKRDYFRDEAGLLGSTFRVARKSELQNLFFLTKLLTRLSNHYEDAQRVASFVDAWDNGLDKAKERFIQALRRLDLSDLAQIQGLLLDHDEQKLGDYLLDVTDRVLQHEIEGDPDTISAADELNKIELEKYPTPHLKKSVDLQSFVYRMLFQHRERLKLSESNGEKVIQFGDIYYCQSGNSDEGSTVLLVVTPACDLARCGIRNILVLPGTMMPLNSSDWTYDPIPKTSVIESDDGEKHWIKWNLKECYTISRKVLVRKLRDENLLHLGRLREIYTAEIQQGLLNEMGRIGQVANPPASFPVSISLFSLAADFEIIELNIDELDGAVCFVGRGESAKDRVVHLVLSESACDALQKAICEFPENNIAPNLKVALQTMKGDEAFFEKFELGTIPIPPTYKALSENSVNYLTIVKNGNFNHGDKLEGNEFKNYRKSPFLMNISDVSTTEDAT